MQAARWSIVLLIAISAGCGGSGGGGGAAPPIAQQSAGGIWFSVVAGGSAYTLMVAETGDLRLLAPPTGTSGPAFGSGAVTVVGNRVEGSLKLRSVQTAPGAPPGTELDCTGSGTVSTRASLQLTIVCTDTTGVTTTTSVSFLYDSRYEPDSSLAQIAGNYTLGVNAATNTLNINGDGTLFGMYHNGHRCLVNGTVSIIHADFNLYRFEMRFSNCTVFAQQYEGVTMIGLATHNAPAAKAGSFHLVLTAVVNGRLESASVLYEPV